MTFMEMLSPGVFVKGMYPKYQNTSQKLTSKCVIDYSDSTLPFSLYKTLSRVPTNKRPF